LLAGDAILRRWPLYFGVVFLGWTFSLMPSFAFVPRPHVISAPALFGTFVIYMVISGLGAILLRWLSRLQIVKSSVLYKILAHYGFQGDDLKG